MPPHKFLRTQIRILLRKWQRNRRNTVTSRKTGIATYAWEPKWQELLAEDALAKLHLEQESLVNHRYAVEVQDLATHWIQSYPCKTNTSRETEKSLSKFLKPKYKPKVIKTNNWLELRKSCEVSSWNHRTSTPHRSETNGIAERAVRGVKQGTSAVSLQSGLDERWWSDSMECYCYLRNVQDFLADRKTPYERRFGDHSKGQLYLLEQWLNIIRRHRKIRREFINLGKKVLPGIFLGYELIAGGIWKGDMLIADLEDLEKLDASDFYPRGIKAKEVLITQKKDDELIFTINSTWYSKIVRKRLRIPRSHSKAGRNRKEWRSQWRNSRRTARVSTGRTNRWRWSPCRFLVDSRWLHLSSSHRFSSSTLCAEGSNISCSSEIHWYYLVYTYWSGRVARKEDWRLLECRFEQKASQIRGEVSRSLLYWKKNLQKDTCGPVRRLTKVQTTTRPDYVWPEVWVKPFRIWKTGKREAKTWQCSKNWEEFTLSIWMTEDSEILKKRKKKTGETCGTSHALQEDGQTAS